MQESSTPRSLPRLIGGWLLLGLGAVLVVVTVLAVIGSVQDHDASGIGGSVFVLIFAGVSAQFGRTVLRGGNRPPPLVAAEPVAASPVDTAPVPGDPNAHYCEWFSQFPLLRTLIALFLLAASIAALALVPGISDPGPQGFLFILPVLPGFYLFGVLLYLPYGIVLRAGELQLGVRGVPRLGRAWRRENVPLGAVLAWQIGRSTSPSPNSSYQRRPRGSRSSRSAPLPKSVGDMRGPGVRYALTLRIDPTRHRIRFPNTVMVGYTVQSAASIGYRNTATIVIGTRRPQRLARALEAAMPGRMSPSADPQPEPA